MTFSEFFIYLRRCFALTADENNAVEVIAEKAIAFQSSTIPLNFTFNTVIDGRWTRVAAIYYPFLFLSWQ